MACAIDLDEFINCEICFEVFDKPQSLTCRHIFCQKCVDRIKNANEIECPVCKVQSYVSDIKRDYRTVAMVDSYLNNLKKGLSAMEEKDDLISKCETCEDDSSDVSHKCETCGLLLCDKCEESHVASDSDHATKAISAIADDTRTEIKRTLKHLKTQEDILTTTLSNRTKEINSVRQACDNAMKAITEKEENLHVKIKSHHDNLKKEVVNEKAKHMKKSKQVCKSIEMCCDDLKSREAMLNSWVQHRSDLSVANSAEQIRKKIQDIEKETVTNQELRSSAETFTVNVTEVNEYDTSSSTMLTFSKTPPVDGGESDKDGDTGLDMVVAEVSCLTLSDYTTAEYRDYVAEKTVELSGENYLYKLIVNIQQHNSQLYCIAGEKIHVYTEDLAIAKAITLETKQNLYADCTALVCVKDRYLITASYNMQNGLRIQDNDGKVTQRICTGEFYGLAILNHKLYAYEYKINKVLIFEQNQYFLWNKKGEIYLNYNGNNEHKAKAITSFLMGNEQIYIADDTSIYHLDMEGKLTRGISQGKDNTAFKTPKICSVDSKGNLLVTEEQTLTVVRTDGKCGVLLRGINLNNIKSAFIGDQNECLWVAHYEPGNKPYSLTKYRTRRIQATII